MSEKTKPFREIGKDKFKKMFLDGFDPENMESTLEQFAKIEENIKAMNNNPTEYANSIIGKDVYFSDLGADIIAASLPNANLNFLKASSDKTKIEAYLTMIGYELPNEGFYQ